MRAVTLLAAVLSGVLAFASFTGASAQDYAAILAAPDRTDADRQNDAKRQVLPFLAFIGAKT